MSLTGTRSPDDRRRRRLAVAGDGAESDDLDTGGVGILREKLGDVPSASPWLPRQRWQRISLATLFWVGIAGVILTLLRPLPPHPQIAPAVDHLTNGTRPILSIYVDIFLWTLAGQFAAIVGWYRSHSQLDFQGRYRVWAWAAVVLMAWGFFAGTSLHTAVAAVVGPQLRWPIWRAETVVWLVPALFAGGSVWWLADRDMQRNPAGVWSIRSAGLILFVTGVGELFARDWATAHWLPTAMTVSHLVGVGLLVTGLWLQAWYVAYISADPPEAREPIPWRSYVGTMLGWFGFVRALGYLWPFRRREAVDAAKPKRRSAKKKEDEEDAEDDAAPKRRRRTAAKTKRPAKPRTRVKPEPEEDVDDSGYEDESATEDAWEEVDDAEAETQEDWTEEYEEEEPPAPPTRTPARSTPAVSPPTYSSAGTKSAPPAPASKSVTVPRPQPVPQDEPDDEGDDDGSQYRVDDGESGSDALKGLSKRQRRELRKQMKDKERQQRG